LGRTSVSRPPASGFASARLGDATRTFAPPLRSELANQVYAVPLAGGRGREGAGGIAEARGGEQHRAPVGRHAHRPLVEGVPGSELANQVYAVPLAGGRETLVLPNAALDATWDPEGAALGRTSVSRPPASGTA
jgi:hypothetical protein